jgi:hypothetical protein
MAVRNPGAETAGDRWLWPFCIFATVWNLAALALVPPISGLAEPVAANLAFAVGGAVTFARFAAYAALVCDDGIDAFRPPPAAAAVAKVAMRVLLAFLLVVLAAWLHAELGLSGSGE